MAELLGYDNEHRLRTFKLCIPPAVYSSTADSGNLQAAVNMTERIIQLHPNIFLATPIPAVPLMSMKQGLAHTRGMTFSKDIWILDSKN